MTTIPSYGHQSKCNTGARNGSQRLYYLMCPDDFFTSLFHFVKLSQLAHTSPLAFMSAGPKQLVRLVSSKYYWFCFEITGINSHSQSPHFAGHLVNFKYQSSCVTPSVWSRVPSKSSASSRAPPAGGSRRTEGPLRYWRRPEVVPRWPGSAAGHGGDARDGDGDSCRCKSSPCWGAPCSAPGSTGYKMRGLTVPSR